MKRRSWGLVLTLGAREQQTRLGVKGQWLMRLKFAEGGSHRAVELYLGTSRLNNFTCQGCWHAV